MALDMHYDYRIPSCQLLSDPTTVLDVSVKGCVASGDRCGAGQHGTWHQQPEGSSMPAWSVVASGCL